MARSSAISLFAQEPASNRLLSSCLVSVFAHGAVLALVHLGVVSTPRIDNRILIPRFTVRHLDLHLPEAQMKPSAGGDIAYPRQQSTRSTRSAEAKKPLPPAISLQMPAPASTPQMLAQPQLSSSLSLLQEPPVPAIVTWSAQKSPARTIVLPALQKPTAAAVRPSLDAPNEASILRDISVTSSGRVAATASISPSTTSPVADQRPELPQMAPVMTSDSSAQPAPAPVISISDLHMREGTVTLPPSNSDASAASTGAPRPGRPAPSSVDGQRGSGNQAREALSGSDSGSSKQRILLPRDGRFGIVVVGASLEEKYPETAKLWTGRMAYTVYVHLGLTKSWILQYSLPRSDDAVNLRSIRRMDAPWPYDMVRPNIDPGAIDADALMVHGFVNRAGRFEALSVLFPPEFPQAKSVLSALEQWQFRPAMQNGEVARVEVLLIIPDERR
jgi:hypothetical protein